MLMRGSSQSHSVRLIKNAVMTTPKDSAASPAMCVNTLAMLTSCVRPRMNNSAVATFTTMASPGDPQDGSAFDRLPGGEAPSRLDYDGTSNDEKKG